MSRCGSRVGLACLHGLGAEFDDIDLAGQRLPTARRIAGHRLEARWWINWKWSHYSGIPYRVTGGQTWLAVVQPTRTRPLRALAIRPGSKAAAFRD